MLLRTGAMGHVLTPLTANTANPHNCPHPPPVPRQVSKAGLVQMLAAGGEGTKLAKALRSPGDETDSEGDQVRTHVISGA